MDGSEAGDDVVLRHAWRAVAVALTVLLAGGQIPALAEEPEKTPNVTRTAALPYTGGGEIAFDGNFVYAGQMNGVTRRGERPDQGGVFIFDTSGGGFRLTGQLHCPGTDNDVAVVKPGLLAISHHNTRCNPDTKFDGIYLVDVSDPARPRVTGGTATLSAHTLTAHPSGNYVYVSPGGLGTSSGYQSIVDVRDPARPKEVSRFKPNQAGCHDMSFFTSGNRQLAFCAGAGEIQTWDVSDPIRPVTIGHTVNPAIQFPHNAVVSPSGDKLVIDDEAFGVHECKTGTSLFGSLWIYDIRIPEAPVLAGRIAPSTSRSDLPWYGGWTESWCSAHNYNFVPGTNLVVTAWFTGGTTVHDITDPMAPRLVASYKPDDGVAYTAHWSNGRVYVNDMVRGMEVLAVDGVAEGTLPAATLTGPRLDMSSRLLPPVLPDRPVRTRERKMENTLFCVITPL